MRCNDPTSRTREEVARLLAASSEIGVLRAAQVAAAPGSPLARRAGARADQLQREVDALAGHPVRHLPRQRRTLRRWLPRPAPPMPIPLVR